jgi:NADH:ubiquinone oxidoreductase subunit 3 (subunit A)
MLRRKPAPAPSHPDPLLEHTAGAYCMLGNFGFVLVLSVVAFIIPLAAIVVGKLLAPRRPDAIKNSTYESGIETIGDAWVQFRAQYYLIGLIFLIFDVEVIFLFPIAVAFSQMTLFGVLATVTFVLILLLGLFFEWRKGALEWS